MNWLERFNKLPPCLCRSLARTHNGRRLMTNEELCARSGLSERQVFKLSHLTSWDNVPMGDAVKFSEACGVKLNRKSEQAKYLKRRKKVAWRTRRRFAGKLLTETASILNRAPKTP